MKPKFTVAKVVGILLALGACFPALEPHIGVLGQILTLIAGGAVAGLAHFQGKKDVSIEAALKDIADKVE